MLSSNLNQHTIATSAALYRPITGSSQNTGQTNSLRVEQLVCRVGLHSPIYNTVRRAVGLLLLRLNIIYVGLLISCKYYTVCINYYFLKRLYSNCMLSVALRRSTRLVTVYLFVSCKASIFIMWMMWIHVKWLPDKLAYLIDIYYLCCSNIVLG